MIFGVRGEEPCNCALLSFAWGKNVTLFHLWKIKFLLSIIYRSSLYLTGNTLCLRYRAQPENAVYCENHIEHTDTVRTS
jgi:hypothetical protein